MKNIKILNTEILSNNWYTLKKVTFEGTQKDGTTITQVREAYDRGNGAVILLYNKVQGTVILTRQFRLPSYVNGNEDGMLIECCAGLLDNDNPEECIRRETEEETGYKIASVQKVFELYMSPGSVTEILYFFVAEYESAMKVNEGGGSEHEHENIEVMELKFADALGMIKTGEIRDAKTIILLQHTKNKQPFSMKKPMTILIAGPYRSGTNDDPTLMAQNLQRMEEAALPLFRAGHIPIIGEWFALPLLKQAGCKYAGDEIYEEISYPIARRLITRCDAILRIEGASKGADGDVEYAKAMGLNIYYNLDDILKAGAS